MVDRGDAERRPVSDQAPTASSRTGNLTFGLGTGSKSARRKRKLRIQGEEREAPDAAHFAPEEFSDRRKVHLGTDPSDK